jgi:hypothetical protein
MVSCLQYLPHRRYCRQSAERVNPDLEWQYSEGTNHDVVPVRISQCNLHRSGAGIQVRFLLQARDESACPGHRLVEIIDPEKQEQTVTRLRLFGARQRRMIVGAPLVNAEQDRIIRVEDLAEVVMRGRRLRQSK